ncbi:sulfur oxidation c-type cytochrome SoxX [Magnetovibrio blakemorei]|uniref:Sulfur oxidation c-type cytochrome SoxX n=1 Tax=Magnetovibrio blakemorei TaxID=28181 RepID=A0A1E5Q7B1_9PROT|nr:sulfur oxidation c-type cytochrome SoxX [Magnetovibrio blakemorei]OEJ66874.1 sulfur oxidation c-type cytochrome SoxX [Magnetovibrio blakemorei]
MKHTKFMTAAIGLAFVGAFAVNAQAADMPKFTIVNDTIPASLTGKPGDAANGRKVAIDRKKGNCLACHVMPIPEQQFHGHVGPDLHGVAKRYDEATLRMRVVDPKVLNEDTMMPSFFTTGQHRVTKKFEGKTILGAQEVEDVIAYLKTLM